MAIAIAVELLGGGKPSRISNAVHNQNKTADLLETLNSVFVDVYRTAHLQSKANTEFIVL